MQDVDRGALDLPACLIIMDGFGLREETQGNAIALANTPNLDRLFETCPHVRLEASGEPVGLPDGQIGNSEVGHLNIGAGRVVAQELTRINHACADGSIARNEVLKVAFANCIQKETTLHFMGLLSDGGVHSSIEHLFALIDAAVSNGVKKIRVHAFLDGRDVAPTSGVGFIERAQTKFDEVIAKNEGVDVAFSSISGRYFAMDRDNRWERVEKAYRSMVEGENFLGDQTPADYVRNSYSRDVTDEFVVPASFDKCGISAGDSVVFFNFRPDRAREITRAIALDDFNFFERKKVPDLKFVCLTQYDETFPLQVAFEKHFPKNVLADVVSEANLKQLHIAETEKYAHVTFFFNGGVEEEKAGETRVLVPSPKVATYDLLPEMSEPEVANKLVEAIEADAADFYIVNFANCDMVGHTGVLDAAIKAVEAVDEGVGEVVRAIETKGGFALVTADHGNADQMIADDGGPHTAHTTRQVPLILCDYTGKNREFRDASSTGALCDIAPTMLNLAGLEIPAEMTGEVLG